MPADTAVRPFPWDALGQVRRDEARALARCARRLPLAALARAVAASAEWLGEPPRLAPVELARVPGGRLGTLLVDPLCAAIIEPAAPLGARLALEIEPRLAAIVVDRVLGGTGDEAPPAPGVLTEAERGVLGYAIARGLAGGAAGMLRLLDVVTTPEALRFALGESADADQAWLVWTLSVRLGDHAGMVRAWIPEALLLRPAAKGPVLDDARATALGAIAVEVVVESGRGSLPASEVASLAPGDVVVLDHASARPSKARIEGEVLVRARGGASRWRCAIEPGPDEDVRLVMRARELGPSRSTGGARMSEEAGRAGARLLEAAGEVPVELVVELARFEMPLAELAGLAPGEVLATGKALGERVVVRAGERVVAVGELVDVEGEVGVRVLSLAG